MLKESHLKKSSANKIGLLKFADDSEHITHEEINRYLYNNLPVNVGTSGILATMLYFELVKYIDKLELTVWYGAIMMVLAIRMGLLFWFRKTRHNLKLYNYHYGLFLLGSTLSAVIWGMLGSWLMPGNIFYQTFILIVVSGIIAGATISLGAKYAVSILYIFFSLVPIIIWIGVQLLSGKTIYSGIFLAMTLYLFYTSVIAHKSSQLIISNIKLKNKNLDLLKSLSKHLNQIELFSQMGSSLEQCRSEQEVGSICKKYLICIFPEFSGGLFLLSELGTRLKAISVWGDFYSKDNVFDFPAKDCLVNKTREFCISHGTELCMHCPDPSVFYVCLPLQTPMEFYGVLHFRLRPGLILQPEEFLASQKALLTRIATNISFALSTIQYQNRLQAEATQDTLTGLFNRRYLDNYCNMEFPRFKRTSTTVAILMIDIDHFKIFNDQYGHETGDAVLHEVGAFLKKSVRGSDFACRFGGEEFMIIMPGSTLEVANGRAESIREGIKHIKILKDDKPIPNITISIGISIFPTHGETQAKVIKAADKALYQAKEAGRDRVCIAKD